MNVTAQSDGGILISKNDPSKPTSREWHTTVAVDNNPAIGLKPTSTINLSNWYKASSKDYNDANAAQTPSSAYIPVEASEAASYYMTNRFYIRSATPKTMAADIGVESITVKDKDDAQLLKLSESIRVGVKIGEKTRIYAPLKSGGFVLTANYVTTGEKTLTEPQKPATSLSTGGDDVFPLTGGIPNNDTGITVDVFIWYEGEDGECKSYNLVESNNTLTVSVTFTSVDHPSGS